MKIHQWLVAGILTAFVALPASATELAPRSTAHNYSPIRLAQAVQWCVAHCQAGCLQRYPGQSSGYDSCMNKCQDIFCSK